MNLSEFWNTPDLIEGSQVVLRRLGPNTTGEYRGKIRGVYARSTI